MKRQPHPLPIVFSTLRGKGNSVIALLQSIVPLILMNKIFANTTPIHSAMSLDKHDLALCIM